MQWVALLQTRGTPTRTLVGAEGAAWVAWQPVETGTADAPDLLLAVPIRTSHWRHLPSGVTAWRDGLYFNQGDRGMGIVLDLALQIAAGAADMAADAEKQEKGNKAAGTRVRTATSAIRKACKELRVVSLGNR